MRTVLIACFALSLSCGPSGELLVSNPTTTNETADPHVEQATELIPNSLGGDSWTESTNLRTIWTVLGTSFGDPPPGCSIEWSSPDLPEPFSQQLCEDYEDESPDDGTTTTVSLTAYQDVIISVGMSMYLPDPMSGSIVFQGAATGIAENCDPHFLSLQENLFYCTGNGIEGEYYIDIFWTRGSMEGVPASRFSMTFLQDPDRQRMLNEIMANPALNLEIETNIPDTI